MNLTKISSLLSQPGQYEPYCSGVSVDTRTLKAGELYIAIEGDTFDGHEFVLEAQAKGACAVVVNREIEGVEIPQFVVLDTVDALARIAQAHRLTMNCQVIALTGSNGKTSTKEMIAHILPPNSLATRGNLNNHIGAPLTALQLSSEHRYAVFELGANHIGEIAHTVAVAHPDVALINNIAPAHVGEFGSIEGVARAKGEIYQGLSAAGIAVINDDDAYAHFWDEIVSTKKVLRFSTQHKADIYAENVRLDDRGNGQFSLILPNAKAEIILKVPGLHNVQNAVAAATCCYAIGISITEIQRGLSEFTGVKGRMTVLQGMNHSSIIDDTYNANLRSVLAALEVLALRPGKKVFVFGDMGELGDCTDSHHEQVGTRARELGINKLLTCGTHSALTAKEFGDEGVHFTSKEDLVQNLLKELGPDTTVLVKGSRSSTMEKIVQKLLED